MVISHRSILECVEAVRERYGDEAVDNFSPIHSVKTFRGWTNSGYKVKRGERAIYKGVSFVNGQDEDGEDKRYPKSYALFHINQVERVQISENEQ